MPSAFVVTTASNTVTLDVARKGTVSLTISNTTGRPVRVRLKSVALGQAKPEWVTFDGGDFRDLSLGGSLQVTAVVAVPLDVAPGAYPVRVDVVAEDQPMEDFAQGPELTIQVPAAAPPPKKFPWWILAVVLAVLVLGSGIVFVLTRGGDDEDLPDPPPSPPGLTTLHASVDIAGKIVKSTAKAQIERLEAGTFEVTFPMNVSGCAYVASIGSTKDPFVFAPALAVTAAGHRSPNGVFVQTHALGNVPPNSFGPKDGHPFHLIVSCPSSSFAVVRPGGQLARGSAGTSVTPLGSGRYKVGFGRDISACAAVATIGDVGNGTAPVGEAFVQDGPTSDSVAIVTEQVGNTPTDSLPFHVALECTRDRFAVFLNNAIVRGASDGGTQEALFGSDVSGCTAVAAPFTPQQARPTGFATSNKGKRDSSVRVELKNFGYGTGIDPAQLGFTLILSCPPRSKAVDATGPKLQDREQPRKP